MLTFVVVLNYMLCGFVTGAFLLQAVSLFPFIDCTYWGDNLRYTAYTFAGPLIAEIATSFSAWESGWYPACTILLGIGWFMCVPVWYYQITLSREDYLNEATLQDNLIYLSRGRALIWVARLILLSIWILSNM